MMADFALHHRQSTIGSYAPKTGEFCSARFTLDNNWYDLICLLYNLPSLFSLLDEFDEYVIDTLII